MKESISIAIKNLLQNKIIKIDAINSQFVLDIDRIIEYDLDFYDELIKDTKFVLNIIKEEGKLYLDSNKIQILNWKETIDISKIRVKNLNKVVKIDGMVCKLTDSIALVVSKTYECLSCGTIIKSKNKISQCSCGGRKFKEVETELQNVRELVLEELQEKTGGKQPQKIRIRLTDNLTDENTCKLLKPGSRVSIIGIIEKIKIQNKTEEELFQYRIFALDILSLEEKYDDTILDEDLSEITEISQNNPLKKLSNSLAPNIYGLEELKNIIILQMVGGVKREISEDKFSRNWINVLVVGTPSTAKSDLGKNANLRCPKSFYTSGDGSSGVGITVAVSRDEILGSWGVEVGPLVKASGSLMIADELDKFPKDQLKALHTPLELGFVKISKAGIDGSFPAETSVLGLANPKYGIFEESKSLVEQINLPPALLSRFDIIYILKDEINKELDDRIVERIYSKKNTSKEDLIDISIFRKYITYSKKLSPELPIEHLEDIKNFYHNVRKKSISRTSNMKGLPIGVRHLQGIIRLAEASAKIRLSEEVEKEDIELAKRLFYESLVRIGLDESGVIDMVRLGNSGITLSKRKYMETLLEIIRELNSDNLSDIELKKVVEEKCFPMNKYYETIEQLNREGIIIKSNNKWKLV